MDKSKLNLFSEQTRVRDPLSQNHRECVGTLGSQGSAVDQRAHRLSKSVCARYDPGVSTRSTRRPLGDSVLGSVIQHVIPGVSTCLTRRTLVDSVRLTESQEQARERSVAQQPTVMLECVGTYVGFKSVVGIYMCVCTWIGLCIIYVLAWVRRWILSS